MSLTAIERETSILWDDLDDNAIITTYSRPLITLLRKNPGATLLEEGNFEGSAWAMFHLPKKLVSFRQPRKLSEAAKARMASNAQKAREARASAE